MSDDDDRRRLLEDDLDNIEVSQEADISGDITTKADTRFDFGLALAFAILGAGMLWPFNSFITANEFFGKIFRKDRYILSIYSPTITFLFTATNLLSTIYFTRTVGRANLTSRIKSSTLTTCVTLLLLALLTTAKLKATAYFILLIIVVGVCGVSTGALQNGCFGIVGKFSPRYVQLIMIGQGIAGITPAILSILVALVQQEPGKSANRRAFAYFLSSSLVMASAYFAHLYIASRPEQRKVGDASTSQDPASLEYRKYLRSYHPWSIFITFAVTLTIFPSITASVSSVLPTEEGVPFKDLPRLLQPAVFIPLGFLLWNGGDLVGRCLTTLPQLSFESPRALFIASICRIAWIPVFFLFNVRGSGAIIKSDLVFFLAMFLFGVSNGSLGSLIMTAAIKQAEAGEKSQVGAFMSLMLCSGLVFGSLLSFAF